MNTQRENAGGLESAESKPEEVGVASSENRLTHETLMTQVLEATLTGGSEALTEAELESLSQVARAYPPETSLELGVISQLVSALLRTRFATLSQEHALLHQMSLRIAGSLWLHPQSQQHLIRFWDLLSRDVRK